MALLCCEEFWCHDVFPHVPFKGKVTTNQHKVVLSDHIYPTMKHFFHDGMKMPPSVGHEGSVNGLMRMIILWISLKVTRSQPMWTLIGDSALICKMVLSTTNIKTLNEGFFFLYPSSRAPQIFRIKMKERRGFSGSTPLWPNCYSSWNCHPAAHCIQHTCAKTSCI